MRRGIVVLAVAMFGLVPIASTTTGAAATAAPPAGALDCTNWRYSAADEPASLPTEFDRNNYKRTSLRDPELQTSPHNLCGQKGAAVDLAWGITRGRPDVRIAVLDSGIKWRDANAMRDLADPRTSTAVRPHRRVARRAATATATAASPSPTSDRFPISTATALPIPKTSS